MVDTQTRRSLYDVEKFLSKAQEPVIKYSDLPTDVQSTAVNIILEVLNSPNDNLEQCTQAIKTALDQRFGGAPWMCVIGKAFSFEVTHAKSMMLLFVGKRQMGVLIWKP